MSAASQLLQFYMLILIAIFLVSLTSTVIFALSDAGVLSSVRRGLLGRRLMRSRMADMLQMRMIDRTAYLNQSTAAELRQQMDNCRRCTSVCQCDAVLLYGEVFGSAFSFCPNTPALDRLVHRMEHAASGTAGASRARPLHA